MAGYRQLWGAGYLEDCRAIDSSPNCQETYPSFDTATSPVSGDSSEESVALQVPPPLMSARGPRVFKGF